jgi:hypothetical protein
MRRKLTPGQLAWIRQIPPDGISQTQLLDLRGAAKTYSMKYVASLRSAIDRCNDGSAPNSPLRSTQRIETGPFGPKGGLGYRLVEEPLVALAHEALSEET